MPATLNELRPLYGGKAAALIVLREHGFRVPEFLVSPADLAAAVEQLGFPLVVRSSATVEDSPQTSFAGQFTSYLNLHCLADVERAVTACHASLKQPSVLQYCRHAGIDPGRLRMEFLLQRMIEPELAGVAFTVDPVTGADEVVIEACAGLAEELLAGTHPPLAADHPTLARFRPRIEAEARDLQRFWGAPQDIEFAIADDELFILQTRNITRIGFARETTEWTNADFRDGGVSATVCTPLMWSLYESIWNPSLKQSLRELHLYEGDFEAARMFFGRPYWNLGAVKRCVSRIPGYVEREFDEDLSIEPQYDGDGTRTPMTPGRILNILPTLWALPSFLRRQAAAAQRLLDQGFAPIAARYPLLTGDSGEESQAAGQQVSEFRTLVKREYFELESTYFRTIFALSLAKLDFRMAFPETDYTELVAALPALSHMAPIRRLREMHATTSSPLKKTDRKTGDRHLSDCLFPVVSAAEPESVPVSQRPARVDIGRLIAEFPHHSRFGLDICHPRWDEDVEFVRRLATQALDGCAGMTGTDDQSERRAAYLELRREVRQRLPFWRRGAFDRKLDRLRRFVWLREELRDLSSRMYHLLRRHVLAIARSRQFRNEADIFFMTVDEILEDDRSEVPARRAVYDGYRNFAAPNEIGPRVVHELGRSTSSLRGIAASPGRVRGPVRVALTIDEALHAPAGAVLVCPFTEPSWTPVLDRVAAVVTETGGLLSHAAVICREYGIPAVLGVANATRTIPDDSYIIVDGSTGDIELCDPT